MSKPLKSRLTYANVVSSIAIFLILGGGSALAVTHLGKNTVGGKQLKPRAVRSTDLKDGAVTGDKIDLETLGKVPSAERADSAESVGGQSVVKVDYQANGGSPPADFFSGGGLTLTGVCATAADEVSVTARTSKDEASIYSFVASDRRPIDPTEVDLEDGDFLVGSGFDMLAGGTGDINLVHFEYNTPDGTVATGTLAVDASFAAGDCHVTGDVIVG